MERNHLLLSIGELTIKKFHLQEQLEACESYEVDVIIRIRKEIAALDISVLSLIQITEEL